MQQALSVKELFTGTEWIYEAVIEIENGTVKKIKREGYNHDSAIPIVVPSFIDLQIYGAADKLLSEFPTPDTIQKIHDYCLASGTTYFQPTVATQSKEIIYQCIDAVRAYKTSGGNGCIGLHIEGPWINTNKKGAHKMSLIHQPTLKEVKELIDYGRGYISMITLAPEICDKGIIQLIVENGIVVSAGHSDATYEQATAAFNNEIKVATHLYNAMSALQHRAPGMVGAIFNHKNVLSSIVCDGFHVDFNAIKIAKQIMGERLFCITDAVTTTTTGIYQHQIAGDKYESAGVLSGSSLTQLKSVNNLVEKVGIELGEAVRMCSLYPARVMSQNGMTGMISVNEKANLLCLQADRSFIKLITF
ncbi:MAG: N-acetylglucosamine-6-phosphate deacetylase [Sediminibacterium sp.]|jgi:N-acetylglucosamine-6-phosphate deacetylase